MHMASGLCAVAIAVVCILKLHLLFSHAHQLAMNIGIGSEFKPHVCVTCRLL